MSEEVVTERQKQINKLQKEISKASNSQKFIGSEEGQYVIGYITELVSGLTNQLISSRKTHEEYIEIRAKIDVLRKLKQVLEVQGDETVIAKLTSELDLASSGN